MKYLLVAVVALTVLACNKKSEAVDPIRSEDKAKAAALTEFLKSEEFRLTKYYSDEPIDYIDTDQVVMQETELWQYVSNWLKDDAYSFSSTGDVVIDQNATRYEADTAAILMRKFSVAADPEGVGFKFVGHEYQPLNYRLISFSDTNLVVWAKWNGKKVISEYKTLP
ncbi:MAG: hypothetical protein JNK79_07190 [Chitinophagaceae bacterium]|nr:hypothetical protein [Chitinophagaceae bacterium]